MKNILHRSTSLQMPKRLTGRTYQLLLKCLLVSLPEYLLQINILEAVLSHSTANSLFLRLYKLNPR